MRNFPVRFYKGFFALVLALLIMVSSSPAMTQRNDPPLPAPLQNLVDEGAQMRYLGQSYGLDGWISIKGGQEQYFYVTPDGRGFVMGILFDKDGRMETVRQVRALQESSDGETLDLFASPMAPTLQAESGGFGNTPGREFKTPSEQLYSDMESSNWIPLGDPSAPYIYTFIDPQCPHCHAFLKDLKRNYIDNGVVQVRMVPVGFRDETIAQAAFLLAVPNPQKRWYAHLDGDETALPVNPDINQQGVQRNRAIMQSWKVNVTPFTVYRAKDGSVKIIQGRAQNINDILADLR